jgi:hypothetical protein
VASSRQPGPIGARIADALVAGTLARCVPELPGPVEPLTIDSRTGPHAPRSTLRPSTAGQWFALGLGATESGEPASESDGLVRIVQSGESDAGYRQLVFETPDEAREAASRLADHSAAARQLIGLSGVDGIRLIAWTTERLEAGDLRILWRRRERITIAEAPTAAPPPAPRRTPAPARPSAPTPAYSTFPAGIDAAAIAQILKDAAKDGTPFCEECMKAALEYTTFPANFDAEAVAESLKSAAQQGIPFCEECMKAQSASTA